MNLEKKLEKKIIKYKMQYNSINTQQTFFQKLRNFDYILLFCIFILGIIVFFNVFN
jgi:rod shape determining protein RodA